MTNPLRELGLVPFFSNQLSAAELENGRIRRVVEVQRSLITVSDGCGERALPISADLHGASPEHRPTVGDWVVLDEDLSQIDRVLERKSVFQRAAAGERAEVQLVAANIDLLFIVTSCNEEFSESRLERYFAMATESGVTPVVVLTKIDLSADPDDYAERARRIRPGVPVEMVNALDRNSLAGVTAWIGKETTVVLVGSSGVGKSTLLNALMGQDVAATSEVRAQDKRGRHTTSHRALYRLPAGGLVIDVPGMRELKLVELDDSLGGVFDEIEALAARCRFSNCAHESEPGCAVRAAVANGGLDERRLNNFRKLLQENARNNQSLAEARSKGRSFAKHVKKVMALKKGLGQRQE